MHDLIIIGGGPAASAAAVYAARKKLNSVIIAETFGGQSIVSDDIQNWIGSRSISGIELAKNFEEHIRAQETVEVISGDLVEKIDKQGELPAGHLEVTTKQGKSYQTKTIFLATGSRRRRLGIPGEDKLDGKGVVFCSTCDAPIFKNKDVVVVGGGNAGLEAVVDLIPYANSIKLLIRSTELKGDAITQEKIKNHPKVEVVFEAVTKEITGETFVDGVKYLDLKTNEEKTLPVQGVFIEIGSVPNADFLANLVERNQRNEVVVNHKTQATTALGIWAAGDVTDVLYKQNNISAGDAVKALLSIYEFLHKNNITGAHNL